MRVETQPAAAGTYPNGFVRKYQRTMFCVPLTLHHLMKGGVRASHGISLDIGEGGLGALVQGSLSVGETVTIDLPLAGSMLRTVAIVRYSSDLGSGFEFVGITREERARIASIAGEN